MNMAWLGGMFYQKHHFVFAKSGDTSKYYMPGKQICDSTVLCWPLHEKVFPGSDAVWFSPQKATEVCLITVVDLNCTSWVACKVIWRSWLYQWHNYPRARTTLSPAIRLCRSGEEMPVWELAANNAYWNLKKSALTDLAVYRGIPLESGLSLFDTLFAMVKHELDLTDDETLDIVHTRLVSYTSDVSAVAAVMEIEGAIELFDHQDHQNIRDQQDDANNMVQERKMFRDSFKDKKTEMRGKKKVVYKKVGLLPSVIQQMEARKFLPPNASIWRDTRRGAWCCHTRPYTRISELWEKHGSDRAALVKILQRSWLQRLEYDAMPLSSCPIPNLFADLAP
jgi:hypothetical protein